MDENRLKISNPSRILRILGRICQGSLPVIIRSPDSAAVSVKGRATDISAVSGASVLRISNISDKGNEHLAGINRVQVEFVMMSTKVMFTAPVVAREQNCMLVGMPTALVSVERRKNIRYACTDDVRAYLDLSIWRPDADEVTAAPFFPQYRGISGHIAIADLSTGGLCAVSRFPGPCTVLRRGVIDDRARLVLPMIGQVEVGVEVRWIKKVKEHVKDAPHPDAFKRFYRFGIEFVSQSEQVKVRIRQLIQQLSQAGAI